MTTICLDRDTPASSAVAAEATVEPMANPTVGGVIARILYSVLHSLALWQERASQRHHLMGLDDRLLRDIGLSRADARKEFDKPFWRP